MKPSVSSMTDWSMKRIEHGSSEYYKGTYKIISSLNGNKTTSKKLSSEIIVIPNKDT